MTTLRQLPTPTDQAAGTGSDSNSRTAISREEKAGAEAIILSRSAYAPPSVDGFLETAKIVLAQAINSNSVTITKDSDLDLSSGRSEVAVRSILPDGTQLEAKRSLQRHSLKWRRLYPYVVAVVVLATSVILIVYGQQWLEILSRVVASVIKGK